MLIYGIDPSLTGTGICGFDTETQEFVCKTITPKKLKNVNRLLFLEDAIKDFILDELGTVFIEGYAFAARGRIFDIGEWGGLLKTCLIKRGFTYYIVPPTTLKLFITNKGNSKKSVMLEQVFRKYGIGSDKLKTEDEVDAYGLCRCGEAFLNASEKEKIGNRVFSKIEGPYTLENVETGKLLNL